MCRTFDVVLLQECGAFAGVDRYDGKYVIAYEQAGALNNRCSTAIIAPEWDSSGVWTGSSSGRPGIWIKAAGLYIGTIHCSSGGIGMTDLSPFMRYMADGAGDAPLVVGGDFNCVMDAGTTQINVGTSSRPVNFAFHTQSQSTHMGGLTLDNFVSRGLRDAGNARRYRTGVSDHDAVSIEVRS
jgi:hypothetical protein